jgi:hypothetical protein
VPAHLLGRPGCDRWLGRAAMRKRLPALVLDRRDKTSFTPLMQKGAAIESSIVRNLMHEPLVVQQRYVNPAWIRRQFADNHAWWQTDQRFQAWLCICLELWLRNLYKEGILARTCRP